MELIGSTVMHYVVSYLAQSRVLVSVMSMIDSSFLVFSFVVSFGFSLDFSLLSLFFLRRQALSFLVYEVFSIGFLPIFVCDLVAKFVSLFGLSCDSLFAYSSRDSLANVRSTELFNVMSGSFPAFLNLDSLSYDFRIDCFSLLTVFNFYTTSIGLAV